MEKKRKTKWIMMMTKKKIQFHSDDSLGGDDFERHGGKRRMMLRRLSPQSSIASNSPRSKIAECPNSVVPDPEPLCP
jgi:hypothetical protein